MSVLPAWCIVKDFFVRGIGSSQVSMLFEMIKVCVVLYKLQYPNLQCGKFRNSSLLGFCTHYVCIVLFYEV